MAITAGALERVAFLNNENQVTKVVALFVMDSQNIIKD